MTREEFDKLVKSLHRGADHYNRAYKKYLGQDRPFACGWHGGRAALYYKLIKRLCKHTGFAPPSMSKTSKKPKKQVKP